MNIWFIIDDKTILLLSARLLLGTSNPGIHTSKPDWRLKRLTEFNLATWEFPTIYAPPSGTTRDVGRHATYLNDVWGKFPRSIEISGLSWTLAGQKVCLCFQNCWRILILKERLYRLNTKLINIRKLSEQQNYFFRNEFICLHRRIPSSKLYGDRFSLLIRSHPNMYLFESWDLNNRVIFSSSLMYLFLIDM